MNCTQCHEEYNLTTRKPQINQCPHTFCELCGKTLVRCPSCQKEIDQDKFKINEALYTIVYQKSKPQTKRIDNFIKVCFVGQSNVGKTSLIQRLKGQAFKQNTFPTIGLDFAIIDRIVDQEIIRFQIWDTAGQQRFNSLSISQIKGSDIVVIVYDITQNSQWNRLQYWNQLVEQNSTDKIRKIIVGNKTDLLNSQDSTITVDYSNDKTHHCQISCIGDQGVQQVWSVLEYYSRSIMDKIIIMKYPSAVKTKTESKKTQNFYKTEEVQLMKPNNEIKTNNVPNKRNKGSFALKNEAVTNNNNRRCC